MPDHDHTLRLRRAHQHLQELRRHVNEWRDSRHFEVRTRSDPDRPGYTCIEAIAYQPPAEPFATLIADCLTNMRSSLDMLAYELASAYRKPLPPDVAEESEFPIFGDRTKGRSDVGLHLFRKSGLRKIRGIDPSAQAEIEKLQPYKRGPKFTTHPLWILHDLDRISKHRLLHPINASSRGIRVSTTNVAGHVVVQSYPRVTMTDAYMLIAHLPPVTPRDPHSAVDVQIEPALQIAFDQDVSDVSFEPVTDVLTRIYDFVMTIVLPGLERFL